MVFYCVKNDKIMRDYEVIKEKEREKKAFKMFLKGWKFFFQIA